jgi:CubicO group peptidase (beta-lactamase class C family)
MQRLITPWASACCLGMFVVACGGDDPSQPHDAGADAAVDTDSGPAKAKLDFTAFDDAVQKFVQDNGLRGASSVIVEADSGVVHAKGYGEFAADRLYLIASSSKVMSVGVLMRLVDAGKLDLDMPISTYLGDWGEYKTDITTAQLISNSSGLVSLADNPLYAPYFCQYTEAGTLSDCAKKIYSANDSKDRKPPDMVFNYGGGQWQLAGGIAEVVSGKSWSKLVEEAYVTPCGASSLGYTNQYQKAGGTDYPKFFDGNTSQLPATDNPSVEGGAYVTAGDYAKLLLMHLHGGLCGNTRVLSEASVMRMQKDRIAAYGGVTPDPSYAGYGLGWWADREHAGSVSDPGAYGAVPWLDLGRKYAAMIMLESTAKLGAQLREEVRPLVESAFDAQTP